MQEFDLLWNNVLEKLNEKYSSAALNLWFEDSAIDYLDDEYVKIRLLNDFKKSIVEKRFLGDIVLAFKELLGYEAKVILISEESAKETEQTVPTQPEIKEKDEKPDDGTKPEIIKYHPGSEYSFENFIVGSSNKFVYAACTAVASAPATDYNPLFIYSNPGLGKTHLLNAIMNEIYKKHPDMNIIYVKGDEFTNQMIESLSHHTQEEFRNKYRKADVLLIDDIQFIAGKEGSQEEFFHTFNALYEDRRQIIMTSDRPPRDINHLEERLRTRFEWGLLADIQPPDYELRTAIIKTKSEMLGMRLPPEIIQYIAENIKKDVRQIEGAVKKIYARCYLSSETITFDLAKECISNFISSDSSKITPEQIIRSIAKKYGISYEDIVGRQRIRSVSRARNIAIYVIRKLTGSSLNNIGALFNRDHTTVLSSYNAVNQQIADNQLLEIEINDIINEITE